jgi:hypothetical protein
VAVADHIVVMKLSKMLTGRQKEGGKKSTQENPRTKRGWLLRPRGWSWKGREALDDTFIGKDDDGCQHSRMARVLSYGNTITDDTVADSEQEHDILADLHELEEGRIRILDRFSETNERQRSLKNKKKNLVPDEVIEIRSDSTCDGDSLGSDEHLHDDMGDSISSDSLLKNSRYGDRSELDSADDSQSCSSSESGIGSGASMTSTPSALFAATSSDDDSDSDGSSQKNYTILYEDAEIFEVASLESHEDRNVGSIYSTCLFDTYSTELT